MEEVLSTCYADIEPEETYSVWKGKLPLKEVVLGAGDGGIGKGFWLADVVARVTRGDVMPDGSESDLDGPKNVILVTPEDHIKRTMAWRLRAADADLSRVFDMTKVLGADFTIPDHLPRLAQEVARVGNVALIGLDPLSQLTDTSLTSVKFIRRHLWNNLAGLAETLNTCVFAMHHKTKTGSVAGSAALVQACRMLLNFELTDEELIRLTTGKTNIAAKGQQLFYELVGEGHDIAAAYREPDIMPDMGRAGDTQRALLKALKGGTPVEYKELADAAGVEHKVARVALHRMVKGGLVEKVSRGVYAATETTPAQRIAR